MPKVLEDRRKAIARSNPNLSKGSTYAIATSALQKEGKMPKASKPKAGPPAYCAGGKVISTKTY